MQDRVKSLRRTALKFTKKIMRLWPCYAISITITYIVTHIWPLPGRTVGFKDFVLNLLWVNRFTDSPYVDGSHWYLGALLSVTAILIVLSYFGLHKRQIVYAVWLTAGTLVEKLTPFSGTYILGGSFVGVICTGISLRYILAKHEGRNKTGLSREMAKWIGIILISIVCTCFLRGLAGAVELCFVLLVFSFCTLQRCSFLNNHVCVFFGMVSYPVYLIHQNIGFLIEFQMMKYNGNWNYGIAGCAVVITIGCGICLYYLYEKPVQSLITGNGN